MTRYVMLDVFRDAYRLHPMHWPSIPTLRGTMSDRQSVKALRQRNARMMWGGKRIYAERPVLRHWGTRKIASVPNILAGSPGGVADGFRPQTACNRRMRHLIRATSKSFGDGDYWHWRSEMRFWGSREMR